MLNQIIKQCLLPLSLCCMTWCCYASQLTLQIPPTTLLLASTIHPLSQRESQFASEEFVIIQALKPLLAKNDYAQALILLNSKEQDLSTAFSPALLAVRAQLAIQQKDFTLAQRDLDNALQQLPDFVRAHQSRAMLYLAIQQWDKAQLSLSKAIGLGGGDAQIYGQLAYIHLRNNNAWAASAAYQQALMLDSDNRYFKEGLLAALLQSKQLGSAQSLVDNMLTQKPDKQSLWLRRANIALQSDDKNTALSSIEVAIRLGDDNAENHLIAAQLHIQKGNYQRATKLLSNTIKAHQWHTDKIESLLAWLERKQQWQHVAVLLDQLKPQITAMAPRQLSLYHLHRGKLALAKGQRRQASQAYQQAIAADPSNGAALLARADILASQKHYTRAQLLYTRAQAITSVREQALLSLAQLLIDHQDYTAALEQLHVAYQEYPHNRGLEKNIQTLTHIINTRS